MTTSVAARRVGSLFGILVALAALGAPATSHATACEVLTSGILDTHDYIASYSDGCPSREWRFCMVSQYRQSKSDASPVTIMQKNSPAK